MRFIALFFIFLLQIAWAEEPWKIAIIGDTHDAPPRMEGSEGVAVNFIKTLYGEILKHQVDMVIQVGDMADVQGSAPVKGLAKRKELNKMLEEKGIPFYALRMLEGFVSLKPGDWIVQNAANSGVGRCIIQLARQMGVRTVNFVRRPDELREELTALGADLVVGENDEDVVKSTLALLDGKRPVLASNAVGGESALRLMDMLAPGGSMVTYGAMSRKSIKVPNGFLIFKGIRLEGLWVTQWLKHAPAQDIAAAYDKLARLMAEGSLVQAVDTVFPLSEVRRAVEKAQEEFRNGKIVLKMNEA